MIVTAIEECDANSLESYFEGDKLFSETIDLNFPINKEMTTPLMLAASYGE